MEREINAFIDRVGLEMRTIRFSPSVFEEGRVLSVGDGIAHVAGLREARLYELLSFEGGDEGIVFDLGADQIGVVLLREQNGIKAGDGVHKTDRIVSVDAGDGMLGHVLDALGNILDEGPRPVSLESYPVEREAPPLLRRDFVHEPLYTGIRVIDAMLPIGRGQRELIIGDSAIGKTSISVDTIINQKHSDVICIYTAIGQKKSHVLKVIEEIRTYGDFSTTIVVVADASASLGLQYIAPYSATAIAEYFLDKGRDVIVVYDDLTKHAEAYRSLSLLLKRPPGREAFPGDIFFIHARLLERAAKIGDAFGGGSITALPIVETQQGRISSYIPTNLISITDGQIYLDALLFNKGILPPVDVGRSVSRIGGRTQVSAMKLVAERLKIDYSRFIDVEVFTKFGAHVEEETARLIRRGERMREILKQPRFHPDSLEDEVLTFVILESGVLDAEDIPASRKVCNSLIAEVKSEFPDIIMRMANEGQISNTDMKRLKDFIAGREG
jgi:F-type H+/Na+-transporting ATPase subunit alpha